MTEESGELVGALIKDVCLVKKKGAANLFDAQYYAASFSPLHHYAHSKLRTSVVKSTTAPVCRLTIW